MNKNKESPNPPKYDYVIIEVEDICRACIFVGFSDNIPIYRVIEKIGTGSLTRVSKEIKTLGPRGEEFNRG